MNLRAVTGLATTFLIGSAVFAAGCDDDDDNASPGGNSSSSGSPGASSSSSSGATTGDGGGGAGKYWYVSNGGIPKIGLTDFTGTDLFTDETPGDVNDMVIGGGMLWAVTDQGKLLRYDLAAPTKAETFDIAKKPSHVAFGGGAVWVTEDDDGSGNCVGDTGSAYVIRWDPTTKAIVKTIRTPIDTTTCDRYDGLVANDSAVYPLNYNAFGVSHIDIPTNAVTKAMPLGSGQGFGTGQIAITNSILWVANINSNFVFQLDPTTLEQKTKTAIPAGFDHTIAASTDALYLGDGKVNLCRVDAADPTKQVQKAQIKEVDAIATNGTGLYIALEPDIVAQALLSLDPATLTETTRYENPALSTLDKVLFQP